ncbi:MULTISPECIES: chitinase [unclassified Streptomyces]|uniref:chitinase n=1 Tax=unclassified Streptomyces TaxID=2593676 RepID=UPI002DD91AE6|nr:MULTISPECIES: chitinase [unclassified Streptomyces]WSA94989.1 chitinase [Streptomyces sp. NBC_01795]WSB79409.1 chitinase [Streptomyces sp. NBC_01775]WSS12386.1 chitinase [Streptomyces sp. NBC_01186]WSS41099.1 chitinase [Streptomyces sp. NBC_01187]
MTRSRTNVREPRLARTARAVGLPLLALTALVAVPQGVAAPQGVADSQGVAAPQGAVAPRRAADSQALGVVAPRGVPSVAPYLSMGWGDPPEPGSLLRSTRSDGFSFAFVLSAGGCEPRWDGRRPLKGGQDERAVRAVRTAGGSVVVSFGGGLGRKLEQDCPTERALAGAYQKVISAYGLRAIDVDIELGAYDSAAARQKTVAALKRVKAANPGLTVYVTLSSMRGGPDTALIDHAARAGLAPDAWTVMPFAFEKGSGSPGTEDMGRSTVRAAEGLRASLQEAYGYSATEAYAHSGISTMNGVTGRGEVITPAHFRTIARYARGHRLARLAFWSVNRDRPCGQRPYPAGDRCSGVTQKPWEFSRALTAGR